MRRTDREVSGASHARQGDHHVQRKITFRKKILSLILCSSLGLAAVTAMLSLRQYTLSYDRFLSSYRQALYADFDSQAKNEVTCALSMLEQLYQRELKGELTPAESRRLGAELLRGLRYGATGYFWADTTEGVNVVLLGKPAEGTHRMDQQDASGRYFIREIISKGMHGGGFTDYRFPKAGETTPQPKRSYSLLFKPFNWVVGTGNYVDDLEAMVARAAAEQQARLRRGILLFGGVLAATIAAISLASLVMANRLLGQIGSDPAELAEIAARVAEGDLSCSFDHERRGIYGEMRRMVEQLRQVMDRVTGSSRSIAQAAVQLNGSADQMASSSRLIVEQAEAVAMASELMAETTREIANNCRLAADSSELASDSATAGASVVAGTVQGMERIAGKVRGTASVVSQLGARGDQIGEIVATIEEIADQTNLLALNAAIEAARAGEQGRGFAVVADEVRALAERTTRATREIGQMIKGIQAETREAVAAMEEGIGEVEAGSEEAIHSVRALTEIQARIAELNTQINQIAVAAEQQAATTREITDNMQQISGAVRCGALSAEQVSSASAGLSGLSDGLQELVRRFGC
ncbi:MAG TPA: methyl-accepting chemotaxis protein [Geomonas sp.]|nr:methyl-accepting chemotaxis protein [Geomonas sp.]